MKNIIFTIIFIAFSTSALAETKVGEDQSPPVKSEKGGCLFTRATKKVDSSSASKTETKKSQTLDIKGN